MSYKTNCPDSIRFDTTMTEFYAKIVPMEKGLFRYYATIWKSHDGIESVFRMRRFIHINMARKWSEKMITKLVSLDNRVIFIRESDILRRKWND